MTTGLQIRPKKAIYLTKTWQMTMFYLLPKRWYLK